MSNLLPRSQFAVFSLGFILAFILICQIGSEANLNLVLFNKTFYKLEDLINYITKERPTLIQFTSIGFLILNILIIYYYLKYRRRIQLRNFLLFSMGILLGIMYSLYYIDVCFTKRIVMKENFSKIISLDPKQGNTQHRIIPIKPFIGNYYMVRIEPIQDSPIQYSPFNLAMVSYDELRIEMICPSTAISFISLEKKHSQYRNLLDFGSSYLKVYKKNCNMIRNHTFDHQIAKNSIRRFMEENKIQTLYQGIAIGLLFGESKSLNSDIYESAKESGTLHLFAASGLHLGILLAALFFLCKNILRLNFYFSLLLPLLIGFYYLKILNYPISLTRAYYFAIALVLGKLLFKTIRHMDLLVVTCFFILLIKPESFLSIGFNLSFSAVVGIFFIKPRLDQFLFFEKKNIWTENLTVSLSATLGTFFSCWYFFPGFSFGGVLANLILVPFTGILLPLLYTNVMISFLKLQFLSSFLWVWTDLFLRILVILTEYFSQTISFYSEWSSMKSFCLYFYFIILFCLFIFPYWKKGRWLYTFSSTLIITAFFCLSYLSNKSNNEMLDLNSNYSLVSISDKASILFLDEELFIGGYCKTELNQLKKKLTFNLCEKAKSIRIDHETCMPLLRKCFSHNKDLLVTLASKRLKDWTPYFQDGKVQMAKKNSLFQINDQPVLLYNYGFDPNWLPKAISKKKRKGILVLLNEPKTNWNSLEPFQRKKSLGLASDWMILDKSEFARFSLLQPQKNPRSSRDSRSKPKEILGAELPH